jgi:sugar-specific transcriptional regulator TrmB
MSLKLALKALRDLGLQETDAQVYIYLAKKGPHKQNDLAVALKLANHQLCASLESLLKRGMVKDFPEDSSKYVAVPFEKVLDEFLNATEEQARALQASRKELLSAWRSLNEKNSSNS